MTDFEQVKCDICGKHGRWSDEHRRFGSMSTFEYRHSIVTCSKKCRDARMIDAFKKKYGRSPNSDYYTKECSLF